MHRRGIQTRNISSEQAPFENVCTCKRCDHGLARDCLKSDCKCCRNENHSMIMDGMEGFFPTDRQGDDSR
jgi:hypothetical protein